MNQGKMNSRKILVTGGTGFIGRALVAALRDRGDWVTAMGRNQRPIAMLLESGPAAGGGSVRFLRVDLRDRLAVVEACAGHDIVYHLGAQTTPWGRRRDFDATNVAGTASVIMGCWRHRVQRLVYVSSPSVLFNFSDQFDLRDDAPYPKRFSSDYARSKALGEVLVQRAARRGLDAVIVRPRAVFGPGDATLFPRLLRVARLGRLPRIGLGDTVTELTYIDNVVHALILAMTVAGATAQTCTITNGKPVALWPVIDRVLATQGLRTSDRTLPLAVAMRIARLTELVWRLLRISTEPPVTRYSVGLLGYSQTFDPRAARETLGYAPVVSLEDGIARTLDWLRATTGETVAGASAVSGSATRVLEASCPSREAQASAHVVTPHPSYMRESVEVSPASQPVIVTCEVIAAGYCRHSYHRVVRGGAARMLAFPATFALLQHPRHGAMLFDTGYAPRSQNAVGSLPFSIYGRLLPVTIKPEWSAVAQLERRGIGAHDIRYVILSHFHADHIGGLRDFPDATYVASHAAYARVHGLAGWRALRVGFIPQLLPHDFEARLQPVTVAHAAVSRGSDASPDTAGPWSVFPCTLDLFGDGSIVLVPLPGHAAGQIGALVRTSVSSGTLLVADACWVSAAYRDRRMPPAAVAPIMDDWGEARRTIRWLHAVWRTEADVTIVPCHCTELHDALLTAMDVPMTMRWPVEGLADR